MTKVARYHFCDELRKALLLKYARPLSFDCPGGIISFTFDDFPRSAFLAGDTVLSRHKVRGTYYVAMGLAGTTGVSGPLFEVQDLADIHRAGHEIACHTFTHPDCRTIDLERLTSELRRNAAAIARAIGEEPTNFAYPYGSINVRAKQECAHTFRSCRGVGRGTNYQLIDLADLFAVPIFAHEFDEDYFYQLIEFNARAGGWLIFFTHDVTSAPSVYGCTPAQLDSVVSYASARSCVMTVREVMNIPTIARDAPRTASLARAKSLALQKIRRRLFRTQTQ